MRWILLAALLVGCDTEGSVGGDQGAGIPPSPPSPVANEPGTLVQQTLQWANPCQVPIGIVVQKVDVPLVHVVAFPGETIYDEIRCAIGEESCLLTRPNNDGPWRDRGCSPCAPGVMPVRTLACD